MVPYNKKTTGTKLNSIHMEKSLWKTMHFISPTDYIL